MTVPADTTAQFDEAVELIAVLEAAYMNINGRFKQLSVDDIEQPAGLALTVDEYEGPDGKGFVVNGETVAQGIHYLRRVNVGPETYRTTDGWIVAPED